MLHVHPINDLNEPGLEHYRADARPMGNRPKPGDFFQGGGEKIVQGLLCSRWPVVSLLLSESWLERLRPALEARTEAELEIFVAEKKQVEAITGYTCYQPVKAIGRIPEPVSVEAILNTTQSPFLLVAVDGLSSAENLGVVVRNSAAFGVDALLVGETAASPFLDRAIRSSMGTIFQLPVVESRDLAGTIAELKRGGVRCVAAHPHTDQRRLNQMDWTRNSCLVLGSEGEGIRREVLEACDGMTAVPMAGGVDSLNVGSAAAVCLYEAARQRAFAGLTRGEVQG